MPYKLVGREQVLAHWEVTLNDLAAAGRSWVEDLVLTGPRGIGKTATMQGMIDRAKERGYEVVSVQAVRDQAGIITSMLRQADSRLADNSPVWAKAKRRFERVAGVSLGVAGTSLAFSTRPQDPPATASAEGIADAFASLAQAVSDDRQGGLVLAVDELQVAAPADIAVTAAALHRLNVDHPDAPVVMIATGLPSVPKALRDAGVTHPDRLFNVITLPGHLTGDAAGAALIEPAAAHGVLWEPEALAAIIEVTGGYPAHLQLFAHHTWVAAPGPNRIRLKDAHEGIRRGANEVERRSFGPHWNELPPREQEFITAVAVAGGQAPIRVIATALGRTTKDLSDLRDTLIKKGDIYSPARALIALSTPLFADYAVAHYEETRTDASIALVALDDLKASLGSKDQNAQLDV